MSVKYDFSRDTIEIVVPLIDGANPPAYYESSQPMTDFKVWLYYRTNVGSLTGNAFISGGSGVHTSDDMQHIGGGYYKITTKLSEWTADFDTDFPLTFKIEDNNSTGVQNQTEVLYNTQSDVVDANMVQIEDVALSTGDAKLNLKELNLVSSDSVPLWITTAGSGMDAVDIDSVSGDGLSIDGGRDAVHLDSGRAGMYFASGSYAVDAYSTIRIDAGADYAVELKSTGSAVRISGDGNAIDLYSSGGRAIKAESNGSDDTIEISNIGTGCAIYAHADANHGVEYAGVGVGNLDFKVSEIGTPVALDSNPASLAGMIQAAYDKSGDTTDVNVVTIEGIDATDQLESSAQTGAATAISNAEPINVNITQVSGVAVSGVDDFEADVSNLSTFDPSTDTVDVGLVEGVDATDQLQSSAQAAITTEEPIDANITQIDGNATNGNNATLNLKQLNINNPDASAVTLTGAKDGVEINCSRGGIQVDSGSWGLGFQNLDFVIKANNNMEQGIWIESKHQALDLRVTGAVNQPAVNIQTSTAAPAMTIYNTGSGDALWLSRANGINSTGTAGAGMILSGTTKGIDAAEIGTPVELDDDGASLAGMIKDTYDKSGVASDVNVVTIEGVDATDQLLASAQAGSAAAISSAEPIESNIVQVAGSSVAGVNDFKADVSGLSTFDPGADEVNVGTIEGLDATDQLQSSAQAAITAKEPIDANITQVAGSSVAGVNDFKADVSTIGSQVTSIYNKLPSGNISDLTLDDTVDGKPLSHIYELIMALVDGRFRKDFPAGGDITIYKRDNATELTRVHVTESERTRY